MLLTVTTPPASGGQVTTVTTLLTRLGYLALPSSVYTAGVAAAVKKFQSTLGILADGKTGPQTLTLLVLCDLVKRAPSPEAVLALSIVWHESGFYPWAQIPSSGTPQRYGLFLLAANLPGNVKVKLPIGTKQTDAEIATAINQISLQWATGLKALQGVSQLVSQLTGVTATPAGQMAWWLRLVALGHKLGAAPGCLQALLSVPAVKTASYQWRAVVAAAAANAGTNAGCALAWQAGIGSGYVDRVMTTAALYAGALGLPTVYYTSDGMIELALGVPQMVGPEVAPAFVPSSPASSPAPSSSDAPPAQATLPPELQPGPGDKLPITDGAVPQIPSVPPGTQIAPAGPSGSDSGSGLLWLLGIGAVAVAASGGRGGGGGRKQRAPSRAKRR